ncbi:MAG: gas vesicle protein [bacterium]|nr:gas vesicle protein [bacterium]RJR06528.1 MAG: gas vesicle protein [Candidatus Parcubacteria bacterium]
MYDNVALKSREVTLFEVLDRILDKGIVIKGDLIISVADVNLIYVGLQAVITSVDRILRVE